MAAAMSSVTSLCLLRRAKTIFSLPRLLTGFRPLSDSATTKPAPIEGADASATDSDSENTTTQVVSSSPSPKPITTKKEESTLSKFVRAVEIWEDKDDEDINLQDTTRTENLADGPGTSFANMLRNSKLFQLGHPSGRVVMGRIFEVHGDDLYIDLGGKFHCVCKTPQMRPHEYRRGAQVKLLLQDLEMSASFLGSTKHVTLLEADATLIGLRRNPSS